MKYLKKIMEIVSIVMLGYILLRNISSYSEFTDKMTIENVLIVGIIIMIFLLIHVLRMIRIYILLIEEKMPVRDFIKLYMKTTFINTVIPFKLGEFYKMISYGEKLKSFSAGLSLVWIDRFFDSLILLILIILSTQFNIYSPICIILVLFIVFSVLTYLTFENTYRYFNLLVLEKGRSKRSILYLEGINESKKVYKKAKNMIRYRSVALMLLSTLIWGLEYLLANLTLSRLFNMNFNLSIFTDYINDVFMIFNTKYVYITKFNILIIIFIFAIIYASLKIAERKRKNG